MVSIKLMHSVKNCIIIKNWGTRLELCTFLAQGVTFQIKAVEQYFPVVLLTMLYCARGFLLQSLGMKSYLRLFWDKQFQISRHVY